MTCRDWFQLSLKEGLTVFRDQEYGADTYSRPVQRIQEVRGLRAMQFSLVFTDLEMPRMHGYELIREMQILPAYQTIPVVVISSRSGQKHIDQALTMGAKEYLTKPFSPEILNAVLGRLARKA